MRVAMPNSVPYVTYTVIGITILVYLLQISTLRFLQVDIPAVLGVKDNTLIRAGQLWRLFTPMLLHDDTGILHIGFNMYALIIFGPTLERYFGRWRFLLLYLLGGFAGNVLSFLLSSEPSLGASTAIFGLIGAEGIFLYQNRQLFGRRFGNAIGNVIFIVVVNLVIDFVPGSGIDYWGHIGGLLGGLIFTWFAGPRWSVEAAYSAPPQDAMQVMTPVAHLVDKRETREVLTGAAIVLLIFGALALIGIIYPITP